MNTAADHIDVLVRRADPAGPSSVAGPDSPKAEEIWERLLAATSSGTDAPTSSRPRPKRVGGLVMPAAAVGAVAIVVILVLQLLPTPALQTPSAAAAVLRHLAGKAAAAEPSPTLREDQWLRSEFRVSYLVAPTRGGSESAALQGARAVVTVNAEEWANNLSQYCSQQVVTSVAYDTPESQQASSFGAFNLPSNPQSECGSGFLGQGSQAPGPLDVAELPTDPAMLAKELETGSTGISALDEPLLTPFGRAVLLLVGQSLGATTALWSALLRAMATLPGVALLGTETTQSGATGVALAGATGVGYRTTIILSPSTGALLEARNLLVGQLLAGLPGTGVLTIRLLDPVGIPQVVDSTMLPASLAGKVPTGIVSALTDPRVTLGRWNSWLSSVLRYLPGNPSVGAAAIGTRGEYEVTVVTYTPDPDVAVVERLFEGSGLVHGTRSAKG
jgi:hypothetical protein